MVSMMLSTRPQTLLASLIQAVGRIQQENSQGRLTQLSELASRLLSLVSELSPALDRMEERKKNRSRTATAKKERIEALTHYCRDFQSVNKKRARRTLADKGLIAFFQIKSDLFRQARTRPLILLQIAQNLIDSEVAAVAAGFEPTSNPSVDQLAPLLEGLSELITEADEAAAKCAESQLALNQLQVEAIDLLRELSNQLRIVYRKLPRGARRNMLRYFGFNFRYEPRDAEEEGSEADRDGVPGQPAPQSSPTTKSSTVAPQSSTPGHLAA